MSRQGVLVALVLLVALSSVQAVPASTFIPHGPINGDSKLSACDDCYTSAIAIPSFPYFGSRPSALYVNNNGLLSFNQEISAYTPVPLPQTAYPMIAAFWADVDTRSAGYVYHRSTTNSTILNLVTSLVRSSAGASTFTPTWAYIATWDAVGYYNSRTDKRNTFQVVLATDYTHSFVVFLYLDGGIQWTTGDASGGSGGIGGKPAIVGFDEGTGQSWSHYEMVEGSLTPDVINIALKSNVGIPGHFVFEVGSIKCPDLVQFTSSLNLYQSRDSPPVVVHRLFAPLLSTVRSIAVKHNVSVGITDTIRTSHTRTGPRNAFHQLGLAFEFHVDDAYGTHYTRNYLRACYHKAPLVVGNVQYTCDNARVLNFVQELKSSTQSNKINYAPWDAEIGDNESNHIDAGMAIANQVSRLSFLSQIRKMCSGNCNFITYDPSLMGQCATYGLVGFRVASSILGNPSRALFLPNEFVTWIGNLAMLTSADPWNADIELVSQTDMGVHYGYYTRDGKATEFELLLEYDATIKLLDLVERNDASLAPLLIEWIKLTNFTRIKDDGSKEEISMEFEAPSGGVWGEQVDHSNLGVILGAVFGTVGAILFVAAIGITVWASIKQKRRVAVDHNPLLHDVQAVTEEMPTTAREGQE